MRKILFQAGAFLLLALYAPFIRAQKINEHDTSYYTSYPKHLAVRVFLSQKYGTLFFRREDAKDIQYVANTKLHLGAGFTIGNLTLNGGIGVGYLRSDAKERGKTTTYDLQLRFFPHKWIIDGILVYNKGYHLNSADVFPLYSNVNAYYYRPDVRLQFVGGSAYRIANADKFSFRAALGQSEWQKKSAGSFLYGADISYGRIKGDSSLVPAQLSNLYKQAGIENVNFFHIGPGVGYAYTLVAAQHFFVTASLIGNLNINATGENKLGNTNNKVSILPGAIYKGAIGYNSDTWSLTADLAGNMLLIKGSLKEGGYILPIGIYRLVLTRKFATKR